MELKIKSVFVDATGKFFHHETKGLEIEVCYDSQNEPFIFYGASWIDLSPPKREYQQATGTGNLILVTIKKWNYENGI